ncbi:Ras guanine nucleotide exchange factor bud5 [Ascochyta rabiei]|uniref:Guanyl-nucleotide exchange factor n=1 Tax=Didymella rabiei TaxID=5454 RepID=A0A162YJW0_DIDRA|nr:Ras guanine nucleotide exchange factor bud5 [Ascochyta rabiei]KZM20086.1 guanyl-nucleotide exchange factor [Ascochyta rabiei]UPX17175.1 Ras guanine nucleotide exchange factor bud5 [Ascochyta rabiei]
MSDHTIDSEEVERYSTDMVAPLSISKSPRKLRTTIFGHSRQSSSRALSIRSQAQSQISPPLTPITVDDSTAEPLPAQPVFHHYLRAFYHYLPASTVSSSTDESSITVAIQQGDVILVHSVHPNGWADGTLIGSGARGWLPTNYCEPYDHPTIRNLLNALTHLWDLVRDGESGNLDAFTRQDYVRGMIAGIRFFLERTDCLSRDSTLIVAHVGLRRMRKGLLGDLSTLVKTAKKLQETLQSNEDAVSVFGQLDELVLKSFKLVTRAVRFLDIWATDAVSLSLELNHGNTHRPLTPPADSADAVVLPSSAPIRVEDDSLLANGSESPVTQAPNLAHDNPDATTTGQPPRNLNRLSVAFSLPSESDVLHSPTLSTHPQTQVKRLSVTHRLSYTGASPGARKENLVSERLNAAQDSFLGFIGSFIGLHLQSRSSDELAHITQQSVVACRQLLTVVEEVWERDSRRSKALEETRDVMYLRLTELVQATKDMFNASDADMDEVVFTPSSGKQLVAAATSCVRSAGDCVAKARLVIEKTGDFELDAAGPGLSHEPQEDLDATQKISECILETDKPLPAPPAEDEQALPPSVVLESKPLPDIPKQSSSDTDSLELPPTIPAAVAESPESPTALSFTSSLQPLSEDHAITSAQLATYELTACPTGVTQPPTTKTARSDSVNASVADSNSTFHFSISNGSVVSHTSTRATTPDHHVPSKKQSFQTLLSSFGSSSELRSLANEDVAAGEEHLLETTYVHELAYNKEGQISGGSLPALVEQLTTHEATPDAVFVTTFYLTFRLFTTPTELAQSLIDRFDYIGNSQTVGVPVRLRVYNVFKGWLESHWSADSDSVALGLILSFATGKLRACLPTAGKRLAELTSKVTEVRAGALVPRLVSSIGKTGISTTIFSTNDSNAPSPIVTKGQLNALRASKEGRGQCNILDFDPMELARQFTIIESKLFCAIQPEELLALEWTKKSDSKAVNVKAMSKLSTDLANLVADTILHLEDAKKRAVMIKHWVKIAAKCLELNNYDSLMAIICSLNSSMVMRLKKTWELVSVKTKVRLDELKTITDVGRNYAVLRQRLQNHVAPCIPFVGIYLTDLTFVDVGNGTTRQLPGESGTDSKSVINFDKHMKTAKIIGQLQSFQVPYHLAAIPEMQDWMEAQIQRVRLSDQANVQSYYRRSLLLEPRELQHALRGSPSVDNSAQSTLTAESRTTSREKFEFLNFNFSNNSLMKGS